MLHSDHGTPSHLGEGDHEGIGTGSTAPGIQQSRMLGEDRGNRIRDFVIHRQGEAVLRLSLAHARELSSSFFSSSCITSSEARRSPASQYNFPGNREIVRRSSECGLVPAHPSVMVANERRSQELPPWHQGLGCNRVAEYLDGTVLGWVAPAVTEIADTRLP